MKRLTRGLCRSRKGEAFPQLRAAQPLVLASSFTPSQLLLLGGVLAALLLAGERAFAQDNYEIQVYSYDTVEPHHTMLESHTNFTVEGSKEVQDGMLPTNH